MKRKLSILLIGAVLILIPKTALAASISLGDAEAGAAQNIKKIPITFNAEESDEVTNLTLTCGTDMADVTCSFEAVNTDVTSAISGKKITIQSLADKLSDGTKIAYVVLTNNETSDYKNVGVNVTSSNGDYNASTKVTVSKKPVVKSSDATLKNLSVSGYSLNPTFDNNISDYVITGIPDTVDRVKITPTCTVADTCTMELTGGKKISDTGNTVYLNAGENKVTVTITSEDGKNEKVFNLTIYQGETTYNSSKLASLSIGEYVLTPAFSAGVTDYTLTIPADLNTVASLITATALDSENASVEITGGDNLTSGENKIVIKVTNGDASETTTYNITITRETTSSITVTNYINDQVTYIDENGTEQVLSADAFKVKYPEEWEKIENGTYQFDPETGSLIVGDSAEEETTTKKSNKKTILIVVLIIVGIVIIAIAGFLIFRKPKDKKGSKKGENKKEKTKEEPKKEEKVEDTPEVEETKEAKEEKVEEETVIPMEERFEDDEEPKKEETIGNNFSDDMDKTIDIDLALNDLMNTKEYDFDFKDNKKDK